MPDRHPKIMLREPTVQAAGIQADTPPAGGGFRAREYALETGAGREKYAPGSEVAVFSCSTGDGRVRGGGGYGVTMMPRVVAAPAAVSRSVLAASRSRAAFWILSTGIECRRALSVVASPRTACERSRTTA